MGVTEREPMYGEAWTCISVKRADLLSDKHARNIRKSPRLKTGGSELLAKKPMVSIVKDKHIFDHEYEIIHS